MAKCGGVPCLAPVFVCSAGLHWLDLQRCPLTARHTAVFTRVWDIHTHTYIHTYKLHIHIYIYIQTGMHAYIFTYMYTDMCVHTGEQTRACPIAPAGYKANNSERSQPVLVTLADISSPIRCNSSHLGPLLSSVESAPTARLQSNRARRALSCGSIPGSWIRRASQTRLGTASGAESELPQQ